MSNDTFRWTKINFGEKSIKKPIELKKRKKTKNKMKYLISAAIKKRKQLRKTKEFII